MPLELYLRDSVYWVRGRAADGDQYIRKSLGTSDRALAEAAVREAEAIARKRRLLGPDAPKPEDELTFAAIVPLYPASPRDATYLKPIVKREGKTRLRDLTPEYIRQLGPKMMPRAAADTWHRQIVTPIRSVINNAHDLGKCPPIRIRRYSEAERVAQDLRRGAQSRVPKNAGSWPWVLAFVDAARTLGLQRYGALAWFMFRHGYRVSQSIASSRSRDLDLSAGRLRVHASKGHPAHWVELDAEEVAMIANLPVPFRGQARDRVFTIAGGRSGALYRDWKAICAHAGIAYLPPHAAGRHGYGTETIVRQGLDPVTAGEDKWSNPTVMLKTYAHPEGAAETIREAFRAGREAAQRATRKRRRKA